jgi:uncharacterized protein (DUF2141 family)
MPFPAKPPLRTLRAAVLITTVAAVPAVADTPPPTGVLSIRVTSLRSNKGKVGCTLYNGPHGFPKDATAALQQRWSRIDRQESTCRFDPIPQGTYAVACFHDENDNGRFDTGLFGIPTEGSVASNHAKGTFGPPKYDDAKFPFSGQPGVLTLRMSY